MKVVDLGLMPYEPCAELQTKTLEDVVEGREQPTLYFVEHPPVLTLGANFHESNLLLTPAQYEERGIQVVRTARGGDVTYHGPGQCVIYPIFPLTMSGRDLHRWMRDLEETMILTASSFGLTGRRFPPHTGVWIGDLKLAAIGVKVRRWVSMHGIAINCNNSLDAFSTIIPCGIQGYGVTSLTQELGRDVTVTEAKPVIEAAFRTVFGA